MKWYEYFMPWRWGRTRYYTNPDKVRVTNHVLDYSQEVKDSFWEACAKLETAGLCLEHKHRITKFVFRPGEKRRPRGWAVWSSSNNMWIGGSCGLVKIMIVVNPADGRMNASGRSDMAHEWGHALLDAAKIAKGDWGEQHRILSSVGL